MGHYHQHIIKQIKPDWQVNTRISQDRKRCVQISNNLIRVDPGGEMDSVIPGIDWVGLHRYTPSCLC